MVKSVVRRVVGAEAYEWLHDLKVRLTHWGRLLSGRDPWFRRDRVELVERHGDWYLTPKGLGASSVIYSLGIGRDVSFDLSVIARFGAHLYAFDPTPSAVEWLMGQCLPREFHVVKYGVAGFDGTADFSPPADPNNPSFRYRGRSGEGSEAVVCEVRRLTTLMAMLGHSHIDLLKMDIEGAEYEVLDDLISGQVPVGQLLVEFHHRKPGIGPGLTRDAVAKLRRGGFELFHMSGSGQEMAFRRNVALQRPGRR